MPSSPSISRPLAWRLIVRRLTRRLPPESVGAILGDLAEDYRTDRRTTGWLAAEWTAWRDAGSIVRAYHPDRRRHWFDGWRFDLRLAVRAAMRQPALTVAVVLPMAFAIAANTALFSIVDGLLFRPLPFANTDRIMVLKLAESSTVPDTYSTYVTFIRELETSPLLSGVAIAGVSDPGLDDAFPTTALVDLGLSPSAVSPGFFDLMGIPLAAGRDIGPGDMVDGKPLPAILGHDVWLRLFAGDRSLVGRVVPLAGRPIEVIGIAPAGLTYPIGANVWVPAGPPITRISVRMWQLARLAPGVSVGQLQKQYPDVTAVPLREAFRPRDTESLVFLLGATALLLLAAWVQTGALMLARAVHRLSDAGVRIALGAGSGRLVRQYVLDGVVLAVLALSLAWLATPVLTRFLATQLPREMTVGQAISPDLRTLLFASAVSALGALLLALTPIGMVRRTAPLILLGGNSAGVTKRAERTRSALLVAQIACSSLLLSVAGLAFHSFVRVNNVDLGFSPQGLWQFTIPSLPTALSDAEQQAARAMRVQEIADAVQSLTALPGVSAAGASLAPLFSGMDARGPLYIAGQKTPLDVEPAARIVSPDFLRALNPRFRSGRFPDPAAASRTTGQFIVNQAFVRAVQTTPEVFTRDLQFLSFRGPVVGVIDDLTVVPGVAARPQIFVPLTRGTPTSLLVRASDPSIRPALEAVLARTWGPSAAARLAPVSDEVALVTAPWRARTVLLGLIALLCVPLVVTGITGALFAAVRARSREIAVRMALGAEARSVHRAIVRRAMRLAVTGVGAGLAGGVAAGYLMSSQLFGVRPADMTTLTGVAVTVLTVAWFAALLPARLAARIAPAEALKER
ncbi:MAG TPA: ABC transporter permease [Vicinamibacterales bacterium]|nr:ABC transporter permease [Vicinamibacterales bacterium]